MKVTCGQGGKKQFWIWSLFRYFAGLANWRWRVVARGSGVKTNNELEVSCFCRRSCCLWSCQHREQRRGGEANGYRESEDRESSEGRRTSYRSVKPLSWNCACLGLQRADDSSFGFFCRAHSTFALHNPSHCAFSIIWGEILSMHFKS